ncbi:MAG TPA: ribonuclease Y [Candidatus Fermentibacter daniensis]|jgi:ribonuclease Y|nr:MAG: ribonuclease Y [Candidatus Fermentibacter daniensis]MBP7719907.1 ribonuclease Y [Candidatus Fermentibacter sp.]OQC70209.1 MAG: Ribonuclease Y [candidate division Hyd24-12 bacterium ADurb.Bin004]KZD18060.1 MAG: ribonuclease Y [Candidatus Fermentibacter daniensis]KZD19262.1 MAG: ribonuclease Y [Candidatus Fermentibacter daniensis]
MSGVTIAILAGSTAAAFVLGLILQRFLAARVRKGAMSEAERILADARRESETLKKEAVLEGREVIAGERAAELEMQQKRRSEIDRKESDLSRRSEFVDRTREKLERRESVMETRENGLAEREQALAAKQQRVTKLMEEQNQLLEQIAGLSRDEARNLLLSNLEEEARLEAGRITRRILEEAERTADDEATRVLTTAIQRCSANHVVENCVAVVQLPGEEMKGRIIGREGRNIRAFETATGVDVIIDDTPEAIVLSCFDPVRREVARQSMEKLISDGRIHPGRIEAVVAKIEAEMEKNMMKLGGDLCLEANVSGVHPQIVRYLGRLRYRTSYGQNMFQHSLEVAHVCGLLAAELRLDTAIARRVGLFHDIGKATDQDMDGSHALVGMELARKFEEPPLICNAIGAHHEEMEPESLYAVLVQAADAVSSARPGARRESLELYVKRLQKLETIADSFDGVSKSYAIQAGREIRIAVKPESVDDAGSADLARLVARRIESEVEYPGQIKVTVIREVRATETAR